MKSLKNKDLRELSQDALGSKLKELKMELMKENAQVAMRTIPKNPGLLRANKKMAARLIALIYHKSNPNLPNSNSSVSKSKASKANTKTDLKEE